MSTPRSIDAGPATAAGAGRPFAAFVSPLGRGALRDRIAAAHYRAEPDCMAPLIEAATLPPEAVEAASALAAGLVTSLRRKRRNGVAALIQEYTLSSQEGVALMCLAEALLRIPDRATRDALIRDKIADGDWRSHLGGKTSLFVNAATWGLLITGRLTATVSERSLAAALNRMVARCGEPVIRQGLDLAMRMMGEQFVRGQTIEEALKNSRSVEARGFRYSYDMLGEAAVTAEDARRYHDDYANAIRAIGRAAKGTGVVERAGISIKLSALHPRYARAQAGRVMDEMLPRLVELAVLAREHDIGLNIDAEESERLELSLDLLEALCHEKRLAGWDGIGFVVQAYGKRCPFVIDWLIDLGRRTGHRLMVRLVKGAYWDAEIKRAQVEGAPDFPVYTRKVHTDVAYLACARKLLAAPDAVFPQFATHNAQTLAAVLQMAGPDFRPGQYEFQCLHGMGEPLYEEVVGGDRLDRPCRIYAPVGTHETLLAYLVRRLLENGANSSFVHRIADDRIPVAELVADPVATARAIEPLGSPNPRIALPPDLFGAERRNSAGVMLADERTLASLAASLADSGAKRWRAAPIVDGRERDGATLPVLNPADRRDVVGEVAAPAADTVAEALRAAAAGRATWAGTAPAARAECLERAADLMEARSFPLLGLIAREAGKTMANAVAEIREAVDFLRYYAAEIRNDGAWATRRPLGTVVCISPWNFPLAIFTGQVAAALAAGNTVVAKPAEETPLIAAEAVRLLLEAGVPPGALQFLPGDGAVGAALVADPETAGVMFTGSTEVARLIAGTLAGRLSSEGRVIPLVAETGGQNAMIVDSSALTEQVVADVIASAFDSAGQRCSALRILCLQEEIADRTLAMLKGAVAELAVGNPDRLATDVGPVISAEAKAGIEAHVAAMRAAGCRIDAAALPPETSHGTFVPPTVIEIDRIGRLEREVFGPVLHVVRYRRADLGALIDDINATGYGLTFGLHTRLDETVETVTARIAAGNLYVNRNTIGAVVGVQPFGGRGLSGTGPKAGGPFYLRRLVQPDGADPVGGGTPPAIAAAFCDWLVRTGRAAAAERCRRQLAATPLGRSTALPGPVGERNVHATRPRGTVLLEPETETGLLAQLGAVLATGNHAVIDAAPALLDILGGLPVDIAARWRPAEGGAVDPAVAAALIEGGPQRTIERARRIAGKDGGIAVVQAATAAGLADGSEDYQLEWLVTEVSTSINTAAAGGNASLMAIS